MSSAATIETTRTRSKGSKLTIVQGSSRNIPPNQLSKRTSSAAPKIMSSAPSTIMAIVAILGFGIMMYCSNMVSKTPQLRSSVYHASYKGASGDLVTPPLIPRSAVIQDTEVFFLMPTTVAKGVLIFFHGCNHAGGQDFFELPEDRIVALAALNRGLAVLAPTSINRKTGCWGHADANHLNEHQVVDKWMESVGLDAALPRMGMGASSGGAFLFSVYQSLGLSSIAPYVSGRGFTESQLAAGNVPPTIFVHMAKDWHTADNVEESHAAMVKAGVAAEKVAIYPHGLTPELCSKRLPEFGDRRCQAFLRDVVAHVGLVDKTDYTVMASYQSGDWKGVMEKHKLDAGLKPDTKTKGVASTTSFGGHSWLWASVEEEIAASFGVHEMTAEHRQRVLDFLMKHAGIELDKSSK